jgi:hypothetical protein
MRFAIRSLIAAAVATALFAAGTVCLARTPVLPNPPLRQPKSILSPKSGIPKSPIGAPKGVAPKKRSWFPFGSRNKKAAWR